MSGLDFQRQLAETGVEIPIIFVTAHGDVPMSVRALKSGAVEFLTKLSGTRICWTQSSRPSSVNRTARERQDAIHDLQQRYQALTAREREVMALVVCGMAQ